jgi:hypothetical protein
LPVSMIAVRKTAIASYYDFGPLASLGGFDAY